MTLTVGLLSLGTTARVMTRLGPERTVMLGMSLMIGALLGATAAGPGASDFPELFFPYALMGTAMLPLLTIAMSGVPEADAGLASGVINTSMQLAGALGIAILGTLAASRTDALLGDGAATASALTGGYHLGFELAAGAVAVGLVIAAAVLRMPARTAPKPAGSELAVEV
jgi:hypothetical protein